MQKKNVKKTSKNLFRFGLSNFVPKYAEKRLKKLEKILRVGFSEFQPFLDWVFQNLSQIMPKNGKKLQKNLKKNVLESGFQNFKLGSVG